METNHDRCEQKHYHSGGLRSSRRQGSRQVKGEEIEMSWNVSSIYYSIIVLVPGKYNRVYSLLILRCFSLHSTVIFGVDVTMTTKFRFFMKMMFLTIQTSDK